LLVSVISSFSQGGGTNLTITVEPQSQTVPAGAAVTFSVAVAGPGPYVYQWQFNGTNLPSGIITTVAGNGTAGYSGDGGPATNARLSQPNGLAADAFGNLFIGDTGNNRVRKVSLGGVISTVAGDGSGSYSGDGGPATNAALNYPIGVAVDASGNLFVAQQYGQRIRKVSTNGVITTFAGNGNQGFSGDGGPAINASLNEACGVALDASGNLLIADYYNNRIRKVDTNGIITTVAGSGPVGYGTGSYSGDGGPATNAGVNAPYAVVTDVAGNLFIADTHNNRIRKVDTNGVITTIAGNGNQGYSGDGGPATDAALADPGGVALDSSGNVFIGDNGNNRVRKVDTNGIITTVAGDGIAGFSGDGGPSVYAELRNPIGVALDTAGNLAFADVNNNRIRKVMTASAPTLTINNVATNDAGNYTVIVSNASQSVTSSVAMLQVNSTIMVNGQLAAGTVYLVGSAQVSFINGFPDGFLFYTLDGSTPTISSSIYFGPFTLTNTATIQVLNASSNDTLRARQ